MTDIILSQLDSPDINIEIIEPPILNIDIITGEKGDKGDPNTLTIGTVEGGDVADATITGESPNQVLNLVLPKGDKGDDGVTTIKKKALGNIGADRFVISNINGTISHADQTNLNHLGKVLGITLNSASDGEDVDILLTGFVSFNGWDFDVNLPIYLGVNGLITQVLPVNGFSQILGFAESPDTIFVNLREPIVL
jgi:hypothetical protein